MIKEKLFSGGTERGFFFSFFLRHACDVIGKTAGTKWVEPALYHFRPFHSHSVELL